MVLTDFEWSSVLPALRHRDLVLGLQAASFHAPLNYRATADQSASQRLSAWQQIRAF